MRYPALKMNDKTLSIIIKANDQASRVLEGVGNRVGEVAQKAAAAAVTFAKFAGTAVAGALTLASKASWDQVGAVEQATVGLKAYEKNADAVNGVLKELITYARSDMGVLFNRKDLFQSAQMLKLNGVATSDLSKDVQILSRSVGMGLGNWQDLNAVVGRVVSTGRLSGIEFDQLTQYGFKLDKSLRNTNVSAEQLFKALDKGIPVDAMAGQANTIQGLGIRIQSAFRGIGDAILGVDSETSKFIEGGLGDRLTKGMSLATTALRNFAPVIRETIVPAINNFMKQIIEVGKNIGEYLAPKVRDLGKAFEEASPYLKTFLNEVLIPIAKAIGVGIVLSIGALIDGITWLLDSIEPMVQFFQNNVLPIINQVVTAFRDALAPTLAGIKQNWDEIYEATKPYHDELKAVGEFLLKSFVVTLVIVGLAIMGLIIIIAKLVEWTIAFVSFFIRAGIAVEDFRKKVWDGLGDVWESITGFISKIYGIAGSFGKMLYGAGRDLVGGLVSGIRDSASALMNTISGLANSIKDKFTGALKIHSPSLVFADYGKYIAQGLSQGIDQNAGLAEASATNLVGIPAVNARSSVTQESDQPTSVFNQYGDNHFHTAEAVDRYLERTNTQKEMGSLGVGI